MVPASGVWVVVSTHKNGCLHVLVEDSQIISDYLLLIFLVLQGEEEAGP